MAVFDAAVALFVLVGAVGLIRQLRPQGARARRTPVLILVLIALSYLLLTPAVEAVFAPIRDNTAYLLSNLCAMSAIVVTMMFWRLQLVAAPPRRSRVLLVAALYAAVAVVLTYLFATSPQRPHGAGFAREFAGNPRMQLYWILQASVLIPTLLALAGVAARARTRERAWRRGLLGLLLGAALLLTVYEVWALVIVVVWPAMPPSWAQLLTAALQLVVSALLVAGVTGPVALGALRGTRLARSYLERLAPLHDWLTTRYPQVRFDAPASRRAESRVTDMLIEVSDGLRLLQRDAPALAAAMRLDHESVRTTAAGGPHHIAYELAAAQHFSSLPSPPPAVAEYERAAPQSVPATPSSPPAVTGCEPAASQYYSALTSPTPPEPEIRAAERVSPPVSPPPSVVEPEVGAQRGRAEPLHSDAELEQPTPRIGQHAELPAQFDEVEGAGPAGQQAVAQLVDVDAAIVETSSGGGHSEGRTAAAHVAGEGAAHSPGDREAGAVEGQVWGAGEFPADVGECAQQGGHRRAQAGGADGGLAAEAGVDEDHVLGHECEHCLGVVAVPGVEPAGEPLAPHAGVFDGVPGERFGLCRKGSRDSP